MCSVMARYSASRTLISDIGGFLGFRSVHMEILLGRRIRLCFPPRLYNNGTRAAVELDLYRYQCNTPDATFLELRL